MTLSHEAAGAGPTVVLLHAGVCDRRMWDPQWAALADAGHRVVRCDLRGFGDTPAPTGPHNDADDVHDLIEGLGVRRLTFVASSFGGQVAIEYAARWPERVDAMALLCSAMPGHEPGAEVRAFGEREDALLAAGDIAGAVELNVEFWLGPDADDAARSAVRTMQRRAFEVQTAAAEFPPIETEVDLSAIRARCLVVSGAHDAPDFTTIAALLADRLTDARHVELPWAGHLPNLERPAETTALLIDFLRERDPATA